MTDQVICINDEPSKSWKYWPGDPLVKGAVYTIRKVTKGEREGYLLHEARLNITRRNGEEIGYSQYHFRTVSKTKTNIEIFRAIDRKIFSKKKVSA